MRETSNCQRNRIVSGKKVQSSEKKTRTPKADVGCMIIITRTPQILSRESPSRVDRVRNLSKSRVKAQRNDIEFTPHQL